jgi:hypothetical protein
VAKALPLHEIAAGYPLVSGYIGRDIIAQPLSAHRTLTHAVSFSLAPEGLHDAVFVEVMVAFRQDSGTIGAFVIILVSWPLEVGIQTDGTSIVST